MKKIRVKKIPFGKFNYKILLNDGMENDVFHMVTDLIDHALGKIRPESERWALQNINCKEKRHRKYTNILYIQSKSDLMFICLQYKSLIKKIYEYEIGEYEKGEN